MLLPHRGPAAVSRRIVAVHVDALDGHASHFARLIEEETGCDSASALAEVRERNLELWRSLGKPYVASFCASCKHSLEGYTAVLSPEEGQEWKQKCVGLSSLLANPLATPAGMIPAAIGYHQPCHWGTADPDLPLLKSWLPGLQKGTGLCCGMGGILKMSNPDLSADMARKCLEGFAPEIRHIVTGCSGCVMQLASAAPEGVKVRHWLDIVDAKSV